MQWSSCGKKNLSRKAKSLGTQQVSKYHDHACVALELLSAVPRSQRAAKPYSPLVEKVTWQQQLFGPIHHRFDGE
jgi:hypothetical protein